MTVTQIYSPTNDANFKDKDTLNELLQKEIDATPLHGVLILHGDANVKVGSANTGWEGITNNYEWSRPTICISVRW